jgi:nitrous-oxide reductase
VITWRITAVETAQDATHGFCIGGYNINLSLEPGEYTEFTFTADKAGNLSLLLHRVLLGAAP